MSGLGQRTLLSLLTERDSMDMLAREGLDLAVVPTEDLRRVVAFALDYFHQSGRIKAPSVAVLTTEFGDLLNDHEISFGDTEESIEWAIDDLKGTYVHRQGATFNKNFATEMATAATADRVDVLASFASELVTLSMSMESKAAASDAREGMAGRLQAYDERVLNGHAFEGMTFGLPEIDAYTRGIHNGELGVFAGGPKMGKSYFADLVALWEMEQRGRAVCLFTLENSIEMTLDRIACLANHLNPRAFAKGECTREEMDRVREWVAALEQRDVPLWVLQPPPGKRTAEAMVREAQLRGADSLIIDQLTFIEVVDPTIRRDLQIREITHTIKTMISTGRDPMPCLLMHQINREGVKAADKTGFLEMYHLAEGSEVERTADWVFGLYRSKAEKEADQAKFQTLAARREEQKHFQLGWVIGEGLISVEQEILL